MGNYIVGAALLVAVLLALRSSLKHFRGEGGCCGGGGEPKPERKKLQGPIVAEKVIHLFILRACAAKTARTVWNGCWIRWTAPPQRSL